MLGIKIPKVKVKVPEVKLPNLNHLDNLPGIEDIGHGLEEAITTGSEAITHALEDLSMDLFPEWFTDWFKGQDKHLREGMFVHIGEEDEDKINKSFMSSMISGANVTDSYDLLYNLRIMVEAKGRLVNLKMYDLHRFAVHKDKPYVIDTIIVKQFFMHVYKYTSVEVINYSLNDNYLQANIKSNEYNGDIKVNRNHFDLFIDELQFLMLPVYYNYEPLSKEEIFTGLYNNGIQYNTFIDDLKKQDDDSEANFKDIFLTYSTTYDDKDFNEIIKYIYGENEDGKRKEVILQNEYYTMHYYYKKHEDTNDEGKVTKVWYTREATLNGESLDVNSAIYILPMNLGKYLTLKDFYILKNKLQYLGMYITQTVHLAWWQTDDMGVLFKLAKVIAITYTLATGNVTAAYWIIGLRLAEIAIDKSNISPQAKVILKVLVTIVAIYYGPSSVKPNGMPINSLNALNKSIKLAQTLQNTASYFIELNEQHKIHKVENKVKEYTDKLNELQKNTFNIDFFDLLEANEIYMYDTIYEAPYDYDKIYEY